MRVKVACIQLQAYDVTRAAEALKNALHKVDEAVLGRPDLMVLPECTYPGYFLGLTGDVPEALAGTDLALAAFRGKAKEYGVFMAVGLVEKVGAEIYNSAYLIGPDGGVVGVARKTFLWHFDSSWFCAGDELPVYDTPLGRIGMIVCADGRQPEISRVLALKGAELIIDVTNWVTSGSNPQQLTNPQYEYMLPTRAVENKVWYAAANKVGMEAGSILYCGRSCIISLTGYELAVASSHMEEIIYGELDLSMAGNKQLDPEFNCFAGRSPGSYGLISRETAELPVAQELKDPVSPLSSSIYASAVQLDGNCTLDEYLARADSFVRRLAMQKSSLVVFPDLPCTTERGSYDRLVGRMQNLAAQYGVSVVTSAVREEGKDTYKLSVLCSPGEAPGVYRQVHLSESEKGLFTPGRQGFSVFRMPFGNLGLMVGYEGLIPEVPRILMLAGADTIAWQADFGSDYHRLFSRTRSAENRVFILAANSSGPGRCGLSLIASPAGAVLAAAFTEGEQAVSAQLDIGCARYKLVVPGTDVVLDRKPSAYRLLAEEEKA